MHRRGLRLRVTRLTSAVVLLSLSATLSGCGGAGSRRATVPAPAAPPGHQTATTVTQASPSEQIATAVSRLRASTYTAQATDAFTVNAGTRSAAVLSRLRRVFPVRVNERESVRPGARTIIVSSNARTVDYEVKGPSVTVTSGGRTRPATRLELAAVRQELAASADFLRRLPRAGGWQLASRAGDGTRRLHAYLTTPAIAADLLPGFAGHPGALHRVKLAIDVYLGPGGTFAGWRVALSCLADLNAISPHPRHRPSLVGIGLLGTLDTRETR